MTACVGWVSKSICYLKIFHLHVSCCIATTQQKGRNALQLEVKCSETFDSQGEILLVHFTFIAAIPSKCGWQTEASYMAIKLQFHLA